MKKRIPYLDYTATPGERVRWENIKGEKLEGILEKFIAEDEFNVIAIVRLDDGTEKEVNC